MSLLFRWSPCSKTEQTDCARKFSLNRDEPLYPLAGEYFACIDVAFGIHGDHVQAEELAAVFAHASHPAHHLAVLAVEEPDMVIREI